MRVTLILSVGLLNFTLVTSMPLESKPDNSYFAELQPIKAAQFIWSFLKKRDCLAICGDSITEQKCICLMEDYLTNAFSVKHFRAAIWLEWRKSWGFLSRMTNDCLRFHPTIATTCYGMNDFAYRPYEESIGQTYYTNSVKVVEAFKAYGLRRFRLTRVHQQNNHGQNHLTTRLKIKSKLVQFPKH